MNNYNQITFTATKSWERSVVFDWLMEISVEFSLMRQTFHLALNYFDRFICSLSQRTNFALAKDEVENEKVFFIGLTCLFIASKVEEIYPPKLSKLLSYAGHFKQNEIKSAELMILQVCNSLAQAKLMYFTLGIEVGIKCSNTGKLGSFSH